MEHDRIPKPGEIYKHFKDRPYQIIAVATHTETNEQMVVYQALYGEFKTFVRPLASFLSEVDHEKYPDAMQINRFEQMIPRNIDEKASTEPSGEVTKTLEKASEPMNISSSSEGEINSLLVRFLDAETYSRKLEVVSSNRKHMSDRLINDMAVSIDCTVEEGPLDQRIQGLMNCLQQMSRFESKRLR